MRCCQEPYFQPVVSILHVSHVSRIVVTIYYQEYLIQTGFIDYTCVTRKSNCCKEILQNLVLRTGCIDCNCVTRKSNCCKEMKDSSEFRLYLCHT